jgi:hypothetical protein
MSCAPIVLRHGTGGSGKGGRWNLRAKASSIARVYLSKMSSVKKCPKCEGELKLVLRVTDYGYVTQ